MNEAVSGDIIFNLGSFYYVTVISLYDNAAVLKDEGDCSFNSDRLVFSADFVTAACYCTVNYLVVATVSNVCRLNLVFSYRCTGHV